jgi:hypothetical protein
MDAGQSLSTFRSLSVAWPRPVPERSSYPSEGSRKWHDAPRDDMTIADNATLLATHQVIFAAGAAAEAFNSFGKHFSSFAELERQYAGEEPVAMTSYPPVLVEEGGWQHLKSRSSYAFIAVS